VAPTGVASNFAVSERGTYDFGDRVNQVTTILFCPRGDLDVLIVDAYVEHAHNLRSRSGGIEY
jgi:hypothetical protein